MDLKGKIGKQAEFPLWKFNPFSLCRFFLNYQDTDNISRFPGTTPFHIFPLQRDLYMGYWIYTHTHSMRKSFTQQETKKWEYYRHKPTTFKFPNEWMIYPVQVPKNSSMLWLLWPQWIWNSQGKNGFLGHELCPFLALQKSIARAAFLDLSIMDNFDQIILCWVGVPCLWQKF